MKPIDRRQFIKTSGYLSIGFSLFGCKSEQTHSSSPIAAKDFVMDTMRPTLPARSHIDAWLQIFEDST